MSFKKAFESVQKTGGASYGLFNQLLNPTTGYMVAISDKQSKYNLPDTFVDFKSIVSHYLAANAFPIDTELENVYLGFWHHNGELYVDFTELIEDENIAMLEGMKRKQIAIFDNAKAISINL